MLWILGCIGTFQTFDGTERVRGALFVEVPAAASVGLATGQAAALVVANSTLPCAPDTDVDDPSTPGFNEAMAADAYWEAQLFAAFTREGALAVGGMLFDLGGGSWVGEYPAEASAVTRVPELEPGERMAAAFRHHVEETRVEDPTGVILLNEIVSADTDTSVPAPGWIAIEEDADVIVGGFDFNPTLLSGDFRAERCDNLELIEIVLSVLVPASEELLEEAVPVE